ncbi:hypothetical protein N665_5040s0001 [Sinapis alba]|nr:hypothetical protein N665_5040s0001 [Sinapis alba]
MGSEEDDAVFMRRNKMLQEVITKQVMDAMVKLLEEKYDRRPNDGQEQTSGQRHEPRRNIRGQREHAGSEETDNFYERSGHSSGSRHSSRRSQYDHEGRRHRRNELAGLKLKIPPFHVKTDPDAYLEWEKKIELVFNCQHYSEIKKIQVAATEFYDYALSWWDQLKYDRRPNDGQEQTSGQRREPRRNRRGQREHAGSEETDNFYERSGHSSGSRHSSRRSQYDHEGRRHRRNELAGLKLKIPPFHGKTDPDAYLEWEKKIELVFNCQHYSEIKKIQVAATEFYDYALSWWDQLVTNKRRNGELPIDTWAEMKSLMRKRFVPSHYHRDLHQRLRLLTQGSRTVEEYFQEMELLMLRANVSEDSEATMARFLGGLNHEIQDRVEMQHYLEIEEMLHKAILVEQQVKRRSHTRSNYGSSRYQTSKDDKPSYQKELKPQPKEESKPISIYNKDKSKVETTSSRARDVKCFKCQGRGHYANECTNKRVMILLENREFESEDERPETEQELSEAEYEEEPIRGRLLVARRTLSLQNKPEEQEQRENLFYTRCMVEGKVCSLIIDGGRCVNVASETMVNKLGLKTQKHPKPYRLQ